MLIPALALSALAGLAGFAAGHLTGYYRGFDAGWVHGRLRGRRRPWRVGEPWRGNRMSAREIAELDGPDEPPPRIHRFDRHRRN
ncbi:MAG TPA: hypothetical protein VKY26_11530 [Actinomycetota bacterium]|nr:hypothetical protein [Actinomycetota bacterium]